MKKCSHCAVVGRVLFPYKHGSIVKYICWSCKRRVR